MTTAGVLLDLDGTLVDTNYLHTIAWSRAFADLGEWAPMHEIHRSVGMGGDQLVPYLLGKPVEAATDAWLRRYEEIQEEALAFPGAEVLIQRLHDLGLVVVLATSAPESLLDASCRLIGGRERFDAVTSSDDAESSKPDPSIFHAAIEAGGLDRQRTLAVGDSIWDIRAARAAGIGCIGLESGGFSRHELSEDGAIAVYRNAEELASQLSTSPIGGLAALST